MTQPEKPPVPPASVEEIQKGWHELTSRLGQLEAQRTALEHENKALRFLLERVIEHRQKTHGELVLLLTTLVSKLPINDVGTIVARLMEHNAHVSEVLAALIKGNVEAALPQPAVLMALEQTKRDLVAALKPAVEELIKSDAPLESGMLQALVGQPELFFSPRVVRANRCFVKGQVPRERIVKEFGEEALVCFTDMTTDPKLNPRPKAEEISLAFKSDFEALLQQNPGLLPDKREKLLALHRRIQLSKSAGARAQRNAFQRLSFVLELRHYYENQSTEPPDVIFAQRLPALVEQMVITSPQDNLDEKLIAQAEALMAFVVNLDHRHMIINNVGKGGGIARTLKHVLKLRADKIAELDHAIAEFLRHLIPAAPQKPPPPAALAAIFRLLKPDMQRLAVRGVMDSDRIRKEDAFALGKAVGAELGLTGLEAPVKAPEPLTAEIERQRVWAKIKDQINGRTDPTVVASSIRDRLHARYDADELKQSWVTLTEGDPISLIRIFCQIPYLADGSTDSIARMVMESYVSRLTHEKYAATYNKVLTSLRNMFNANPHSPTLVNFMALVKWVDPMAANKVSADIGMPIAA